MKNNSIWSIFTRSKDNDDKFVTRAEHTQLLERVDQLEQLTLALVGSHEQLQQIMMLLTVVDDSGTIDDDDDIFTSGSIAGSRILN